MRSLLRFGFALLVASLAAALAAGCATFEPAPKEFTPLHQRAAKAEEAGNTLEQAEIACKEQTKQRGIKSVVSIFSRLRPGVADQDYIECMRQKGYEVKE